MVPDGLIIMLIYRKLRRFNGELFLVYLFGYGLGRFWIEGLRTDQLLIPKIGLPVSQILAGVLVVASLALIIYKRIELKKCREGIKGYHRYPLQRMRRQCASGLFAGDIFI